jgi:hypothetical protein
MSETTEPTWKDLFIVFLKLTALLALGFGIVFAIGSALSAEETCASYQTWCMSPTLPHECAFPELSQKSWNNCDPLPTSDFCRASMCEAPDQACANGLATLASSCGAKP